MIILSKVISSKLKAAQRLITSVCFGKKDARESNEAGPYGFDSCPIPGIIAVYMDTCSKGDNVIMGYVGKNQIAQPGESRIYSTDTGGTLKYFVYCKADKILIGTGTPVNHFTQYEALNTALQAEKNLINTELTKIATGLNAIVAGSYTMVPITVDISAAETTNILTN